MSKRVVELSSFKQTIMALLAHFDKDLLLQIISDTKEDYRGDTALFLDTLYEEIK